MGVANTRSCGGGNILRNNWQARLRPLLVMGVLAAPAWLGGCGGSGHDSNAATSNGPLKAGDIVSEKGTVEEVPNPIGTAVQSPQGVYILKGDSGRVYEDFSPDGQGLTFVFRQAGLRVSFTATVIAPAGAPVGTTLGIPIQITQVSKL